MADRTITVNIDHTASLDKRWFASQGEQITVDVVLAAGLWALGYDGYIDFIMPDGSTCFKGPYDCSTGTISLTLGAVDSVLDKDGKVWWQFVLAETTGSVREIMWLSEQIESKVLPSILATTSAILPYVPQMVFPVQYPAANISVADVGGLFVASEVEDVLSEIGVNITDFSITPRQFGAVGDGTTDDTIAIQAAIDYCAARHITLKLNKVYKVTQLVLDTLAGFSILSEGGVLRGYATGSYSALLDIIDCQNVIITGGLEVNCLYNTGYECGVWVRDAVLGACGFIMLTDIVVSCAKLAFRIGDISRPDAAVANIVIDKAMSFACPCFIESIGCQTISSVVNSIVLSDDSGGDATWIAIPKNTVKVISSFLRISNCDVMNLISQLDDTFTVEPIHSPLSGNLYGTIHCANSLIESASQLAIISNPLSLTDLGTSGNLVFDACLGFHSGNSKDFIYADSDYHGTITVHECNFYGGVARTYANIKAIESDCKIWCDNKSFGTNFLQGDASVVGGTAYDNTYVESNHRETLATGIKIERSGRIRTLHIIDAASDGSNIIGGITLAAGDRPAQSPYGMCSYSNTTVGRITVLTSGDILLMNLAGGGLANTANVFGQVSWQT